MVRVFGMTALACVSMVLLASCLGDVASPSNYMSDVDTTTITTETTTTEVQTAEQTLSNTRNVCAGLIVVGSCNTTQSNTQSTGLPKPAPKPQPVAAPGETDLLTTVCGSFLVAVGIVFWCLVALWVLKKVFGEPHETSY